MSNQFCYQTSGDFHINELSLNFFISSQETQNPYLFPEMYDISQKVMINGSSKIINGILVFIKKTTDNGDVLDQNMVNFPKRLDLSMMKGYPNANSKLFDFNANDAIIMLFHDDKPCADDIADLHKGLINQYKAMADTGITFSARSYYYSSACIETKEIDKKPRTVGLSLIKKRS